MKRSKPWIEDPNKEEERMTFPSLDRALDYLSGQNPDMAMIVFPVRAEGGAVAYKLTFQKHDEIYTPALGRTQVRLIRLNLTPDGQWGLNIF